MKQGYFGQHWSDALGNPAGGVASGRGFMISWQNGQLGRGAERVEPNGAFVEDVIQAVIGRIEFYETSSGGRFSCIENQMALKGLREAAEWLDKRTRDREARAVEGTHAT